MKAPGAAAIVYWAMALLALVLLVGPALVQVWPWLALLGLPLAAGLWLGPAGRARRGSGKAVRLSPGRPQVPSAINRPVPPPPPAPGPAAPTVGSQASRSAGRSSTARGARRDGGPNQRPLNSPVAEAEAYLKVYGPSVLRDAMKGMLDAAFALATCDDLPPSTRQGLDTINLPTVAAMVAMILMRSGYLLCQSARGELSEADILFLFHTARPLLLLADLEHTLPPPTASLDDKRQLLEDLCRADQGEPCLAKESLEALDGFHLLAIHDQLNGCPLRSSTALTGRMRHALLKYLHTLVDCDGEITEEERNGIAYLEGQAERPIREGVAFAKRHPSASRQLKRSPYALPELVMDPSPPRDLRGTGIRSVSQASGGATPLGARDEAAVEAILAELRAMTGLASVKAEITSHINTLKVSAMRRAAGLAAIQTTNHMVFTGNPGTGKTTVARKLAALYRALGLLSKGTLQEVDPSALVAGYVGQTALKTKAVLDQAKGGVLFIDEAYALSAGPAEGSFGDEAIATLLKYMEDYREDLIVIVAGYTEPMQAFLRSNPGLKSRFNKFIEFPDYSAAELREIFIASCHASGYAISPELDRQLLELFTGMTQHKPEHFGNGRTVRNVLDRAVVRQANRLVAIPEPSHQQLMELTPADLTAEDLASVVR